MQFILFLTAFAVAFSSCVLAGTLPDKLKSGKSDDQTSAGGHHQSEWVPAAGHAVYTAAAGSHGGGAHSFVAGGQSYGHSLAAAPSSSAYFNPYGYHAVQAPQPSLHTVHSPHAHSAQYAYAPSYAAAPAAAVVHEAPVHSHGHHEHGHGHEHGHAHGHSVPIPPPIAVPGYQAVVADAVPVHPQKKVIHQHHEHQKVIHQHHIHQHIVHEHHLHKVHLHDLHLEDHNIHQHHKHIEHIHQPIYHVHKKHALKETEEHQTRHTHGESHEHLPGKVIETKSHASPVYAGKTVVPAVVAHHGHHGHVAPAAPIYYKSAPLHHAHAHGHGHSHGHAHAHGIKYV